eukprot:520803-Amorphochlora_amoeboformis.AAC.1
MNGEYRALCTYKGGFPAYVKTGRGTVIAKCIPVDSLFAYPCPNPIQPSKVKGGEEWKWMIRYYQPKRQ